MIRITDEEIFSMTKQEYRQLMSEYYQVIAYQCDPPSFESWLRQYKAKLYTTYTQENP
jgi:hypothetical protein